VLARSAVRILSTAQGQGWLELLRLGAVPFLVPEHTVRVHFLKSPVGRPFTAFLLRRCIPAHSSYIMESLRHVGKKHLVVILELRS